MKFINKTLIFMYILLSLVLSNNEIHKFEIKNDLINKNQIQSIFIIPTQIENERTEGFTLKLFDSYGDGWDNSILDVFLNGVLIFDNLSVASNEETFNFQVDNGDLTETVYTSGSDYENEIRYAFYDNSGALIISEGPLPSTGISFYVQIATPDNPILSANSEVNAVSLNWTPILNNEQVISCAETMCGYYLNYGYSCTDLATYYGYDCTACEDEGLCSQNIINENINIVEIIESRNKYPIENLDFSHSNNRSCWNHMNDFSYFWTDSYTSISLYPIGVGNVSLTSVKFSDYSNEYFGLTYSEAFVSIDIANENGETISNITSGVVISNGQEGLFDLSEIPDFNFNSNGNIKVSITPMTNVGDLGYAPFINSDSGLSPSGLSGLSDDYGVFWPSLYNWDIELCADAAPPTIDSFNLYRNNELYQSGLVGNNFSDFNVDTNSEYCYTLSQNMPDNSESLHSPLVCATPIDPIGFGETCYDPLSLSGTFPIFASGDGIGDYLNDYGEYVIYLPWTPEGGDMVYSYTPESNHELIITIDATYDNSIGVFTDCGNPLQSQVAGDDSNYEAPFSETVKFNVYQGVTYYIVNFAYYPDDTGSWTISLEIPPPCIDDNFEDDDTKENAVNHGGDGVYTYSLCLEDNPGGIPQLSEYSAIDWSVVTLAPFTHLTVTTEGIGNESNDIDLFIETLSGDGICWWGDGDDLAGSGNYSSSESVVYFNESPNSLDVYIGAFIWYIEEEPSQYQLTISTVSEENLDAPRNLTATQSPFDNSQLFLNWTTPFVDTIINTPLLTPTDVNYVRKDNIGQSNQKYLSNNNGNNKNKINMRNYNEFSSNHVSNRTDPGDSCEEPMIATSGINVANGLDQWFSYTATMDGLLTISSQNEAGDAIWDTY